jgi:hypothetical protein
MLATNFDLNKPSSDTVHILFYVNNVLKTQQDVLYQYTFCLDITL